MPDIARTTYANTLHQSIWLKNRFWFFFGFSLVFLWFFSIKNYANKNVLLKIMQIPMQLETRVSGNISNLILRVRLLLDVANDQCDDYHYYVPSSRTHVVMPRCLPGILGAP